MVPSETGVVGSLVITAGHIDVIVLRECGIDDVVVHRDGLLVDQCRRGIEGVGHLLPAFLEKSGILRGLHEDVPDHIGTVSVTRTKGLVFGEITLGSPRSVIVGVTNGCDVVPRTEEVVGVIDEVESHLRLQVDRLSAIGAALGGDEDHAVGGAGTVESGGTGILEDLHGLNILGVDVVEPIADLSVDDDERRSGAIEVGTSAEDDCRHAAGITGVGRHLESRDGAGERLGGIGVDADGKLLVVYLGDGVGQLRALLLTAVPGDHHLVE